jgi:hypothetical protein
MRNGRKSIRNVREFRWEMRGAHAAVFRHARPTLDTTLPRGLHVRRERLGSVPRSRAILCRAVPDIGDVQSRIFPPLCAPGCGLSAAWGCRYSDSLTGPLPTELGTRLWLSLDWQRESRRTGSQEVVHQRSKAPKVHRPRILDSQDGVDEVIELHKAIHTTLHEWCRRRIEAARETWYSTYRPTRALGVSGFEDVLRVITIAEQRRVELLAAQEAI